MEKEIISRIKNNDKYAFEALYNKYASYALRTAYLITKNKALAQDAVQECFVKIYFSIDSFDEERPFKPYLYRALVNECYSLLKKNSKTVFLEDFPVEQEQEKYYEDFYSDKYSLLYKGISRLNINQRVPIILMYFRGFKEKEIAEILDININTLKSRLFKGRQKLKDFLRKSNVGEEYDEYKF